MSATEKVIKTKNGNVNIFKATDKVTFKYGNRYYTRAAWEDENGGVWVKFSDQYNLLKKKGCGDAAFELLAWNLYGCEI